MIILTGSKRILSAKFLNILQKQGKEVVEVEKNDSLGIGEKHSTTGKRWNASSIKGQCLRLQTQT